ncbi:60S ribosome biogenesis protein Rrp14, putative [Penicillium digitatum PHI26]|uniref:60S ribosome biogenesis protein Rrp14, putative n=3 Tax=Penicillium digitatum TaxID=36651 RepID=K9FIU9_PEND2|nr:60S ribosome biogenesis protein Rrp14, putative [Penicillium digitatum Pd1]EKV07678.1 60S ribosome biogenesis protein Rrp14, putative [Penicillium digitatum Pd1]EKV09199.1 60S ribosome biogenesis protein Rrp14, putative [Penicillium digitatum PHI26]
MIRHGEKPRNPYDHGLTPDGVKRAQCLRHVFGQDSKYNIGHIMAPRVEWDGAHGRAFETVLPLAKDLGLTVDTHCRRNKVKCVARAIRSYGGPGNILIAWRHSTMGGIEEELGSLEPIEYPDERFDLIWTDPWPYGDVKSIKSEECPGLDVRTGLVDQETIMDDIEERLRSHAQAFDGLLSLIPAKYYYGEEDTSDQWQRKKQTKEQAREAKRAKLNPEAAKTAKDVMDENARKRKREDGTLESDSSDGEMGTELPREGLNRGTANIKKQKQVEKTDKPDAAKAAEAEARKKQKEEKKAQKKAAQMEKKKAKDAARKEKSQQGKKLSTIPTEDSEKSATKPNGNAAKDTEASEDEEDEDHEDDGVVEKGFSIEFNVEAETPSSAPSITDSPSLDASNSQSGTSSISSIVPPSASTEAKSSEPKPLKHTPEELKQRLQKRLDELRAKRHADGLNGKPARNRQELIEARRQKAEQRKAHKKELREKAKIEEEKKNDEAMARRFSPGGSGSLLASPRSPAESIGSASNNFSFGRVMFTDGQQTDITGTNVREKPKTSGARDPASQLKAVEAKKARLEGMDPAKRADVEDKDLWLNAKKRAHGERVRDDTSLLKKALKRKETAKKKSAREWRDRIDTVAKSKEQRQAKRDENLRKRRDDKGTKGGKKKSSSSGKKKAARPGFEGSFKGGGKNK